MGASESIGTATSEKEKGKKAKAKTNAVAPKKRKMATRDEGVEGEGKGETKLDGGIKETPAKKRATGKGEGLEEDPIIFHAASNSLEE
jgi:hypothetical protein